MAKVTVHETPTKDVIAGASAEYEITDSRGRSISLRKPGVLAQYRLVEMVGPESAMNQVYMAMIAPITFVISIDGDHVFFTKKSELEALIQRLDDDGVKAVMDGVEKHFGAIPDPEKEKAALKK